ncbi:MAG: thiosulfate oxidation carrier protein SoxY [Rhodospirillales bacterium]|nr:thiosulfate oxidation carrier protein SoxY [Rhodospirillales bacterium]
MTRMTLDTIKLTRRQALAAGSGAALALAVQGFIPDAAWASPTDAKEMLTNLTGGALLKKGRVHVTLPRITDKGPFTRITVAVDSPMTDGDFVKAVHLVAERNTVPEVASFFFTPMNGKAEITTRIRLKKTQIIVAVAEMSDDTIYIGKGRTKVSRGGGGCG